MRLFNLELKVLLLSEMAAKGSQDYWLVDNDVDLKKAVAELKGKLERNTRLAVDCEGVSLSRKGELTVIVIATEEKAYIFDCLLYTSPSPRDQRGSRMPSSA